MQARSAILTRTMYKTGAIALLVVASAIAASCGGSSSESPWPVEPETPVLGPAGEEGKSAPPEAKPDAGADAAPPDVEP